MKKLKDQKKDNDIQSPFSHEIKIPPSLDDVPSGNDFLDPFIVALSALQAEAKKDNVKKYVTSENCLSAASLVSGKQLQEWSPQSKLEEKDSKLYPLFKISPYAEATSTADLQGMSDRLQLINWKEIGQLAEHRIRKHFSIPNETHISVIVFGSTIWKKPGGMPGDMDMLVIVEDPADKRVNVGSDVCQVECPDLNKYMPEGFKFKHERVDVSIVGRGAILDSHLHSGDLMNIAMWSHMGGVCLKGKPLLEKMGDRFYCKEIFISLGFNFKRIFDSIDPKAVDVFIRSTKSFIFLSKKYGLNTEALIKQIRALDQWKEELEKNKIKKEKFASLWFETAEVIKKQAEVINEIIQKRQIAKESSSLSSETDSDTNSDSDNSESESVSSEESKFSIDGPLVSAHGTALDIISTAGIKLENKYLSNLRQSFAADWHQRFEEIDELSPTARPLLYPHAPPQQSLATDWEIRDAKIFEKSPYAVDLDKETKTALNKRLDSINWKEIGKLIEPEIRKHFNIPTEQNISVIVYGSTIFGNTDTAPKDIDILIIIEDPKDKRISVRLDTGEIKYPGLNKHMPEGFKLKHERVNASVVGRGAVLDPLSHSGDLTNIAMWSRMGGVCLKGNHLVKEIGDYFYCQEIFASIGFSYKQVLDKAVPESLDVFIRSTLTLMFLSEKYATNNSDRSASRSFYKRQLDDINAWKSGLKKTTDKNVRFRERWIETAETIKNQAKGMSEKIKFSIKKAESSYKPKDTRILEKKLSISQYTLERIQPAALNHLKYLLNHQRVIHDDKHHHAGEFAAHLTLNGFSDHEVMDILEEEVHPIIPVALTHRDQPMPNKALALASFHMKLAEQCVTNKNYNLLKAEEYTDKLSSDPYRQACLYARLVKIDSKKAILNQKVKTLIESLTEDQKLHPLVLLAEGGDDQSFALAIELLDKRCFISKDEQPKSDNSIIHILYYVRLAIKSGDKKLLVKVKNLAARLPAPGRIYSYLILEGKDHRGMGDIMTLTKSMLDNKSGDEHKSENNIFLFSKQLDACRCWAKLIIGGHELYRTNFEKTLEKIIHLQDNPDYMADFILFSAVSNNTQLKLKDYTERLADGRIKKNLVTKDYMPELTALIDAASYIRKKEQEPSETKSHEEKSDFSGFFTYFQAIQDEEDIEKQAQMLLGYVKRPLNKQISDDANKRLAFILDRLNLIQKTACSTKNLKVYEILCQALVEMCHYYGDAVTKTIFKTRELLKETKVAIQYKEKYMKSVAGISDQISFTFKINDNTLKFAMSSACSTKTALSILKRLSSISYLDCNLPKCIESFLKKGFSSEQIVATLRAVYHQCKTVPETELLTYLLDKTNPGDTDLLEKVISKIQDSRARGKKFVMEHQSLKDRIRLLIEDKSLQIDYFLTFNGDTGYPAVQNYSLYLFRKMLNISHGLNEHKTPWDQYEKAIQSHHHDLPNGWDNIKENMRKHIWPFPDGPASEFSVALENEPPLGSKRLGIILKLFFYDMRTLNEWEEAEEAIAKFERENPEKAEEIATKYGKIWQKVSAKIAIPKIDFNELMDIRTHSILDKNLITTFLDKCYGLCSNKKKDKKNRKKWLDKFLMLFLSEAGIEEGTIKNYISKQSCLIGFMSKSLMRLKESFRHQTESEALDRNISVRFVGAEGDSGRDNILPLFRLADSVGTCLVSRNRTRTYDCLTMNMNPSTLCFALFDEKNKESKKSGGEKTQQTALGFTYVTLGIEHPPSPSTKTIPILLINSIDSNLQLSKKNHELLEKTAIELGTRLAKRLGAVKIYHCTSFNSSYELDKPFESPAPGTRITQLMALSNPFKEGDAPIKLAHFDFGDILNEPFPVHDRVYQMEAPVGDAKLISGVSNIQKKKPTKHPQTLPAGSTDSVLLSVGSNQSGLFASTSSSPPPLKTNATSTTDVVVSRKTGYEPFVIGK